VINFTEIFDDKRSSEKNKKKEYIQAISFIDDDHGKNQKGLELVKNETQEK
jgi:hypothetical protein